MEALPPNKGARGTPPGGPQARQRLLKPLSKFPHALLVDGLQYPMDMRVSIFAMQHECVTVLTPKFLSCRIANSVIDGRLGVHPVSCSSA